MPKVTLAIAAPIFTLCVLGGVWADRAAHDASDLAYDQYFERVRCQAQALPMSVGAWVGADAPIPPSIGRLRPPDLIVSRTYRNLVSGGKVDLLLVYRRDARDLIGQELPMGYAAGTWTLQSAAPSDRYVDNLAIAATRYEFVVRRTGSASSIAVDDFFILPSGRTCRDRDELRVFATATDGGAAGAARVQIVSHGRFSWRERDELTATFVRISRPAIEAISQGVNQ